MIKKSLVFVLCLASGSLFAVPAAADWSKVSKLADVKGKSLDCEKLPLMYTMGLKSRGVKPVDFFKKAVENKKFLKEAMYHTDKAVAEAMEMLAELDKSGSKSEADLKKVCQSESFIRVKKGLNLVLRALYMFGVEKGFIDKAGNLSLQGKVFVACISGIVGHSMTRQDLKTGSKVLVAVEKLKGGKKGLEEAVGSLDKSWTDPKEVIRFVFEVRVLTADICHDVPTVRTFEKEMEEKGETVKSPDAFFDLCETHLEGDGSAAFAASAANT